MKNPNYTVGAGRVWLQQDEDPAYGERCVGSSPGFSYAPSVDTTDVWDSDNGVLRRIETHVLNISETFTLAVEDISVENLQLFSLSVGSNIHTPSSVKSKTFKLRHGNQYDLGGKAIRDLTATYEGEPFNLVNIILDGSVGLLRVRPGAPIYEGQEVTFNFVCDGVSFPGLESTGEPYIGSLRYVENNLAGVNRVLYIPKLTLLPDGEVNFKESAWRSLNFRAEVTSVPLWIDREMTDDYKIGAGISDFGDLSTNPAAFTDDYGVHSGG